MSTQGNKTSRQSRLQKILLGLGKHFSNVPSVTLGGVSYPMADLKRLIQGDLDTIDATAQAKADYRAKVQVERDTDAQVNPTLRLLKAYVIAYFGDSQDAAAALDDFGYSPRKTPKKSVETKAQAIQKTEATREARHTLGRKQKARIKGTAATSAPATPPAAPALPPKA